MTKISEIDALRAVDEALAKLEEPGAQSRVVRWAAEKYLKGEQLSVNQAKPSFPSTNQASRTGMASTGKPKAGKGKTKPVSLSFIKDLNLRPQGQQAFSELVKQKQPASNFERCVLAVYYLKNILGIEGVSYDHVYTCFKATGWRLPADLANALQVASSRKGWLDTKNRFDVKITTLGENLVEHDLQAGAAE